MDIATLKSTASAMVASGKGILAADESTGTIKKRFDSISVESTEETRLSYRQMLFTTPGIEEFISGVILYDETIRQSTSGGVAISTLLSDKGIIPGIKVDKGAKDMANFPEEKVTEGLDGLRERLTEYKTFGAKFAKWRAVIVVEEGIPTDTCIESNAEALARYSALCQEADLVPIVEPEVLMDGAHDLKKCQEVTQKTLEAVFDKLKFHKVVLEGVILKPNMVISGKECATQASAKGIAKATVETFLQVVPKEVSGIVFLSGGQTPDQATENLKEINLIAGSPWQLSYSYGRALQDEALKTWKGKAENIPAAQQVFIERCKKVSDARSQKSA